MAKVTGIPPELTLGMTYGGVIQGIPDGEGGGVVRMYRTHKVSDASFAACYKQVATVIEEAWDGGGSTLAEAYIGLGEMFGSLDFDAFYRYLVDALINDEFNNCNYDGVFYN